MSVVQNPTGIVVKLEDTVPEPNAADFTGQPTFYGSLIRDIVPVSGIACGGIVRLSHVF